VFYKIIALLNLLWSISGILNRKTAKQRYIWR